jgi:hypothetical protein
MRFKITILWGAFRIYGPTAAAFDGTWILDDIVEMK